MVTYYDECSLLLHNEHEHILMTHDDMEQAMEVLGLLMTRPGEVQPQKPKMTVSLRQKTSVKQAASPIVSKNEKEKTTEPLKTPDDPVVTDEGDQARQTKVPGGGQAQTQVLAGEMRAPNVEAKTNDLILNIRGVIHSPIPRL